MKIIIPQFAKELETTFLSSEMLQSMKIPLQDEEGTKGTLDIFSEFLEHKELDDKAHGWACSQLKKKIIEEGVMIMEQLGRDVRGMS